MRCQVNTSGFQNGDWVEVKWSGVQDPAADDLVALYLAGVPSVSIHLMQFHTLFT